MQKEVETAAAQGSKWYYFLEELEEEELQVKEEVAGAHGFYLLASQKYVMFDLRQ